MKKVFVLIGIMVSLLSFSQSDLWKVDMTLYGDTIIYFTKNGADWHGNLVSVDVNFKYPEDNTGKLYLGGTNKPVSNKIGVTDFKTYTPWDNNPIPIDTTSTDTTDIYTVNGSLWWGAGYSCTKGFPFDLPAFRYVAGTCDSVQLFMYWRKLDD
jgi:hypothetical protein